MELEPERIRIRILHFYAGAEPKCQFKKKLGPVVETESDFKVVSLLSRKAGLSMNRNRNKFQPEFAFFLEPERFGTNFSFTGTGVSNSQINFVQE